MVTTEGLRGTLLILYFTHQRSHLGSFIVFYSGPLVWWQLVYQEQRLNCLQIMHPLLQFLSSQNQSY